MCVLGLCDLLLGNITCGKTSDCLNVDFPLITVDIVVIVVLIVVVGVVMIVVVAIWTLVTREHRPPAQALRPRSPLSEWRQVQKH